jgi:hypothetical protein
MEDHMERLLAAFRRLHHLSRIFKDSNGDGIGDIGGIISLDYLHDLGVNLLVDRPDFCKSPMDDNGYDVSDYYSINPKYGTMADLDRFSRKPISGESGFCSISRSITRAISILGSRAPQRRLSKEHGYYFIPKREKEGWQAPAADQLEGFLRHQRLGADSGKR